MADEAFSTEDCQLGGLDVKELMTGEPVESLEIREEEATVNLRRPTNPYPRHRLRPLHLQCRLYLLQT